MFLLIMLSVNPSPIQALTDQHEVQLVCEMDEYLLETRNGSVGFGMPSFPPKTVNYGECPCCTDE